MATPIEMIRGFCKRAFPGRKINDNEDIFASGFANSLFAMRIVDYVESSFGIEIDGYDLDIANFRSIAAVAKLVERKIDMEERPANAAD